MRVLPQTPLDWVLLAVATATAVIIAVAMQDFFIDARHPSPKLRALQGALEAARRVPPRTLVDEPLPRAMVSGRLSK